MIEQDYSAEELKKEMLNEACKSMEAYYSDLYTDFQDIDKMKVGETAQWFYRKKGTSFQIEDPERFAMDLEFWHGQVFRAYTILKTGRNKFSVTEIEINKPK